MRRPLAITILGWLFIITGAVGIVRRIGDFDADDPLFGNDAVWVMIVGLLAAVGGVFILRGVALGRWLLIGWMVYHVILSTAHTTTELIIHTVFLVILIVVLFNRNVSWYFR